MLFAGGGCAGGMAVACVQRHGTPAIILKRSSMFRSFPSLHLQQSRVLQVLVVEDDPDFVDLLKDVLDRERHKVKAADTLRKALQCLQTVEVDLVLLDLNLPKVAGLEVLRELRASSPCKDTPVIVVTSSTAGADRAAVQRLGAQAYFQKPTDLKAYMELALVIKRVLKIVE